MTHSSNPGPGGRPTGAPQRAASHLFAPTPAIPGQAGIPVGGSIPHPKSGNVDGWLTSEHPPAATTPKPAAIAAPKGEGYVDLTDPKIPVAKVPDFKVGGAAAQSKVADLPVVKATPAPGSVPRAGIRQPAPRPALRPQAPAGERTPTPVGSAQRTMMGHGQDPRIDPRAEVPIPSPVAAAGDEDVARMVANLTHEAKHGAPPAPAPVAAPVPVPEPFGVRVNVEADAVPRRGSIEELRRNGAAAPDHPDAKWMGLGNPPKPPVAATSTGQHDAVQSPIPPTAQGQWSDRDRSPSNGDDIRPPMSALNRHLGAIVMSTIFALLLITGGYLVHRQMKYREARAERERIAREHQPPVVTPPAVPPIASFPPTVGPGPSVPPTRPAVPPPAPPPPVVPPTPAVTVVSAHDQCQILAGGRLDNELAATCCLRSRAEFLSLPLLAEQHGTHGAWVRTERRFHSNVPDGEHLYICGANAPMAWLP